MIIDKHVHTPYCPHGSTDPLERYIERAISLGYREISFTEHAPLPGNFIDPTPEKDSAMALDQMPAYLEELGKLKAYYSSALKVNIGLEVDFIEGYEKETSFFLDQYGPLLDDSILSVHFLRSGEAYYCMDYSEETFEEMIRMFGGLTKVYEAYFSTLKKSIVTDLGTYKPSRIGHITLVEKFKRKFPHDRDLSAYVLPILDIMSDKKYELDYNGAGFTKPLCLDSYPPAFVALEAHKRKIPLVYGSDAHSAKGLMQGYNQLERTLLD
ncbi:histidinol-phosphatase HisJ [Bacillus tianshenii]|uniref:histidinol-phosphatase HisJ n=1 Tax=Sutcliffiella tianshenii TaxID=1463404 RepID=UPI001CD65A23|nr:histidinol-phosphatase HisJ [Bacillus tianshenii]MCA1319887.1 histidinol-phosphatase HisJ [Bacillus tianshenii]